MALSDSTSTPARTPFQRLPLKPASVLQRISGRRPRENAWIEVNNLLADAETVRSLRPEQVAHIAERYGLKLQGEFCGRLERLYRDYLVHCLADRLLTEEEIADLAHLKRLLRLSDQGAASIHEHVAKQVYSASVDEVLADGRIDPEERAFLDALQQRLALSAAIAERIIAAKRRRLSDNTAPDLQ